MLVAPPRTEAELLARADRLAGRTLAWLAAQLHARPPSELRQNKGWIGQVLETGLGASSHGAAQPDFPHLGVELKTLPVTPGGVPLQSTFVAVAPLDGSLASRWEESWVRRKLARVLWIPIVGERDAPPGDRVVGSPLLWSPTPDDEARLRRDWEELAALIATGELWQIDGRRGEILQLRPKAQRASDLVWTLGDEGEWVREHPRAFYLRARFTRELLARHFAVRG